MIGILKNRELLDVSDVNQYVSPLRQPYNASP